MTIPSTAHAFCPCCFKKAFQSLLIYWLPWSECTSTLFTGERRHIPIRGESKTNSFVILLFIDQPITRLENRSTITARYNHPLCVLIYVIYVISVTQDWFGAVGLNSIANLFTTVFLLVASVDTLDWYHQSSLLFVDHCISFNSHKRSLILTKIV